jgi:hypothetical protein
MDAMATHLVLRRAIDLGFIVLITLACGCSSSSDSSSPPVATVSAQPTPTTAPSAAATTDAATPDLVAAKVKSFTHNLHREIDDKSADNGQPTTEPVATATTQPSDDIPVDLTMLAPDAIHLSQYPQEDQPVPAAPRTAAPVASGDANFPMIVPENADRQASAVTASDTVSPSDPIERKLIQHIRDYPKDLDAQLDYQLLMFVEDQPVPQMSAISGLHAEDRELLSAILDGLSNFRSVIRGSDNALLEAKARPLLDMADRLRTQAELNIPSVALCTQVQSFGVFKPIDASTFVAGADHQVIVYCEVQGFQSQLTPDSQWQTKLSQEMTLYTETGQPVWPDKSEPQTVVDLCRQHRRDFFIAKLVTLPANLSVGKYVLKVTVTDEEANRVAEATTPVEIVAQVAPQPFVAQ